MRTYTASSSELTLLFSEVSFCHLEREGKKEVLPELHQTL